MESQASSDGPRFSKIFGGHDNQARPTAMGASRIFKRFLLVAVAVNVGVGILVVSYDISHSASVTHEQLQNTSELLVKVATGLRATLKRPDEEVVRHANRLTQAPMALLDLKGNILYSSHPDVGQKIPKVYPEGHPTRGTRIVINEEINRLSGAWSVSPFGAEKLLLVVAVRTPDQEGMFVYLSIAAALSGFGIVLSVIILLAAANWMLRRPLDRIVEQLTSALQDQLAFRQGLLDSSESVGIVASDGQGVVRVFNAAASNILAYSREQMEDRITLDKLLKKCQRPSGEWALDTTPAPPPREGEELWVDRSGRERLLSVSSGDIHDKAGQRLGRLIIFVDITERRRLEEELIQSERQLLQSAKMATLGEMATGVAHELNQPLNNIGLLTSRLQMRLEKAEITPEERSFTKEKLGKVQKQIERATRIIEHLRTFGRPSKFKMGNVDPAAAVNAVMDLLREQLAVHNINLDLNLAEGLPAVYADEGQLEQVLINLVVNAKDALDVLEDGAERKLKMSAFMDTFADGTAAVALVVEDSGGGIPLEVQERIFDPFFSTKEVGKGIGLGLSISYGLVRGFGGTLEVSSSAGVGSSFIIKLKPDLEVS